MSGLMSRERHDEEMVGHMGAVLLVPILLAGCAAGGTYSGAGAADTSNSYVSPVLDGTAPALKQWYTAPYFDPYETP
jgi:hypothetical protein